MNIPIIGEPKMGDWSFTLSIICTCNKVILWMGKPAWAGGPGSIVGCGCGKMYTLLAMPERDQVTGNLHLKLAMKEAPRSEG
jgi:hypothetical protein